MNDIGGVDVEATSEQLVHEVLAMIVGQILSGVNNSVHIGLHQISDDVNIFVSCGCWWFLNVHEPDDVFVVKEF